MAQTDITDQQLKQTVAMGRANQALLPTLRNWCQHLLIEDHSAGLVAQTYQLPINLRLACPHSSGEYTAMNLEWIARDFILENCVGCTFHTEIFLQNFGRLVIDQHRLAEQEADRLVCEQASQRQALQDAIDNLVRKEQSQATITALSILKLVQRLQVADDRPDVAETILEASNLSPHYFGDVALNYLALYFDDPSGERLLQTVYQIQCNGRKLQTFAFEQVIAILKQGQYIDIAVGVFDKAVTSETLAEYEPLITQIIEQLQYEHHIGDPYDRQISYPNVVSLMSKLADTHQAIFRKLLRHSLQSEDKHARIKILGLLQELIPLVPQHILPLTEVIALSLDLPDDPYNDSADHATYQTLVLLYKQAPEEVMAVLQQVYSDLSPAGQEAMVKFYGRALSEKGLLQQVHAEALVKWLITELIKKITNEEVQKKILEVIKCAVDDVPLLFNLYFEPLLGFLITSIGKYRTFLWYQEELKRPADQAITFNPLLGKHFTEILLLDSKYQHCLSDIEQIIQRLLKQGSSKLHHSVKNVFQGLNSPTDGNIKSRLLKVLRCSVTNPLSIGDLLPTIYSGLFDTESGDVRREAVRYLEHLLDKHPGLVTQTLLDVIKVFLTDPDISIRASAVQAYCSLIDRFPQQVDPDHTSTILASVTNEYRVLHKAAAQASYSVVPFLTSDQKRLLISGIIVQEQVYFKEQEFDYCEKLLDILLFLTQDNQRHFLQVVQKYVVKYCNCGHYYTELDAVKRLTGLAHDFLELQSTWLQQTLHYLIRVAPDFGVHSDYRNELFTVMYQLPYATLIAHQQELVHFVHMQTKASRFSDVFLIYAILGAQGLHTLLHELTQNFVQVVPANKSNETVLNTNNTFARLAKLESTVATGQVNATFVNSIRPQ